MGKRFYVIGFLLLTTFDTLTQISIKLTTAQAPVDFEPAWLITVFKSPWTYVALGGYLCTFVTWMTLLKHAPVGPSFAASHLELVSVTLVSVWLFNEPLTTPKLVGGLLIILGVLCLSKTTKPVYSPGH